jgi:hypothetical protein
MIANLVSLAVAVILFLTVAIAVLWILDALELPRARR